MEKDRLTPRFPARGSSAARSAGTVQTEPVEGLTDVEAVAHEAVDLLVPAPDGVIRKILLPELPKDEAGSL